MLWFALQHIQVEEGDRSATWGRDEGGRGQELAVPTVMSTRDRCGWVVMAGLAVRTGGDGGGWNPALRFYVGPVSAVVIVSWTEEGWLRSRSHREGEGTRDPRGAETGIELRDKTIDACESGETDVCSEDVDAGRSDARGHGGT